VITGVIYLIIFLCGMAAGVGTGFYFSKQSFRKGYGLGVKAGIYYHLKSQK
jgi:hypothetical protein